MSRPNFFAGTSSEAVPDFQALPIKTVEEKLKAIKEALKHLKALNQSPDFTAKANILLCYLNLDMTVPNHSEYPEMKLTAMLLALANPRHGFNALVALSAFLQDQNNTMLDQTVMHQIVGSSDHVNAFAPRR